MDKTESFVEFKSFKETDGAFVLTDESAASLQARLNDSSTNNFGGLKVHGIGRFVGWHLPNGLSAEGLNVVSDDLAKQIGCMPVASSIMHEYNERERVAA